jgi:hypothetical protein
MDPYLEDAAYWGGFHTNVFTHLQSALNRSLPARYFAEIDEYVWLQDDQTEEGERLGKPDTFVSDTNGSHSPEASAAAAVATLALPVEVTLPTARKRKHRYLKIVGPDHKTVVTVIEVLSPSNKRRGHDRDRYLDKRNEYLAADTNLDEIDLRRDGARMEFGKPTPRIADYYLFVCRGNSYPRAAVWPFTVRESIPTIPVPLRPEHGDTPLDLQSCVTDIYDTNRYAQRLDYSQPPVTSFGTLDAEWAANLLKDFDEKRKNQGLPQP